MPAAVASRYARALVDLATRPGAAIEPHAVIGQFASFERAMAESAELRNVLLSPAVPPPRKRAVITRLAETLPLSDLVKRFLLVVIDHRRAALLDEIREAFEAQLDERLGVARVDVTSARELSEPQRQAVTAGLARLTGKRVRTQFAVDPELLGGVVARIGSIIYDGSVRGRLEALKQRLAAES